MPNSTKLDSLIKKMISIARKYSKEVEISKEELIWYDIFDTILDLKNNKRLVKKWFCKIFFSKRLNHFILELVNHIPFDRFLYKYMSKQEKLRFFDIKPAALEIFSIFK